MAPILAFVVWLGEDGANERVALVLSVSFALGMPFSIVRSWRMYKKAIPRIEDICEREAWDEMLMMF